MTVIHGRVIQFRVLGPFEYCHGVSTLYDVHIETNHLRKYKYNITEAVKKVIRIKYKTNVGISNFSSALCLNKLKHHIQHFNYYFF